MDNKKIDQQFRTFFENRSISPAPESWNRLDMLLDAEDTTPEFRKLSFYRIAAVMVLVLTCMGIGYHLYTDNAESIIANSKSNVKFEKVELDDFSESVVTVIPKTTEPLQPANIIKPKAAETEITAKHVSNLIKHSRSSSVNDLSESVMKADLDQAMYVYQPSKKQELGDISTPVETGIRINPELLLEAAEYNLKNTTLKIEQPTSGKFRPDPAFLLAQAEAGLESKSTTTLINRMYKEIQDNSAKIYATLSNRNYEYK